MTKSYLSLVAASVMLCGCAADRLQENTLTASASTTDLYYQMVLQNLARAYAQPGALPWGMALSSGNVAVNNSYQLMGGYSETMQQVMPSANAQFQVVLQQGWATAPVSNQTALKSMMQYYKTVVDYARNPKNPRYLSLEKATPGDTDSMVGWVKVDQTDPQSITHYQVKLDRPLTPGNNVPVDVQTPPDSNAQHYQIVIRRYRLPKKDALFSIDLASFHFRDTGVAPPDSVAGSYENKTAYVTTKDVAGVNDLALFTMLILGTIDNIPAKTAGGQPKPQISSSGH